jgi:hypothetical protein
VSGVNPGFASALPGGGTIEEVDAREFGQAVGTLDRPLVVRGLVAQWPAVEAANSSPRVLVDYLRGLHRGASVRAFVGEPGIGGRFFYRPTLDGFNFSIAETDLPQLLETLLALDESGDPQSIYMGSTPTTDILPRFEAENPLPVMAEHGAGPRMWIGTGSRVAAHFDESDNVACVVSGRRRFTLFPTEQVSNLYVGPIDQTVAGQPTSIVDLAAPDFERFPRFREALEQGQFAELEPGDAIYIPSLWWHAVEAQGPLNVLVNYWWQYEPGDGGSPMHVLAYGLMSISHLAERKRERYRTLFDHYVFRPNSETAEHIPPPARGVLGRSTRELRAIIRRFLIAGLTGP